MSGIPDRGLINTRVASAPLVAGWIAVVAALSYFALDAMSLWWDETNTAVLVRMSLWDVWDELVHTDGSEATQPLYYLVLDLWTAAVGTSEVALRLPSAVAVLATVPVLWRIVTRLGARSVASRMLVLSLPLLPFVYWYGAEARPYALIMLLAASAVLFALRSEDRAAVSLTEAALATLVAALLAWSWVATAPLALGLWLRTVRGSTARRVAALGGALAVAMTIPAVLAFNVLSGGVSAPRGRSPVTELLYAAYELVAGRTLGPSVNELRGGISVDEFSVHWAGALVAGAAGLVLLTLGIRGFLRAAPGAQLVLGGVVAWAAIMVIVGAVMPFALLGRHVAFVVPAIVALAALGAEHSRGRSLVLHTVVLASLVVGGLVGFHSVGSYAKEDFRTAARIIRDCPEAAVSWAANPNAARYYLEEREVEFVQEADVDALHVPRLPARIVVLNQTHFDEGGSAARRLAAAEGVVEVPLAGLRLVVPADCLRER